MLKERLLRIVATRKSPVQLVRHFHEVPASKRKFPCIGQVKYDGVWCGIMVFDYHAIAFSRTGKPFKNLQWLADKFVLAKVSSGIYIGELTNDAMSLEGLSGMVSPNRVQPLMPNEIQFLKESQLHLHDFLEGVEFDRGHSASGYKDRYDALTVRYWGGLQYNLSIRLVHNEILNSIEDSDAFLKRIVDLDGEGIVHKEIGADWVAGHKGHRVMKRVRGFSVDLMCIGYTMDGKGKRAGLLTKMLFEYHGKPFAADLGLGYDSANRQQLTDLINSSTWEPTGKIWRVYALQESSKGVLRLPKVGEQRFDKIAPDN